MEYCRTYNQIIDVVDITDQSGEITEPVSLTEMKNFLRLEGFSTDSTNIVSEAPLSKTLLEDETEVQDDLLKEATILTLAREGLIYTKSNVVGNRKFTHDPVTGIIGFQSAGEPGGEGIDITYGYAGSASGDEAFDFDNDLIEELITASRERIERYCGISIVNHRWSALITNLSGNTELPFSNGFELVSIKDYNDTDIVVDNYKFRGLGFKTMETPLQENVSVVYDAGMTSVPKSLKQAIMRDVAFHYENRNDSKVELAEQAMVLANPYKRVSTWLA